MEDFGDINPERERLTRTGDSSTRGMIDSILGRVVIDQGLATNDEVTKCLSLQRKLVSEQKPQSLAKILVAKGVVTKRQIERATKEAENRKNQQIPGYEMLDRLGAGAMATVYKARQVSLDRTVAVKILPKKFTKDPEFVERFYAEGRAAGNLNHPHIVQAIDVGKAGEHHYFVMEYVEGYSVHEYLQSHRWYAEQDALRIAIEVAQALSHAHERGFIHRDVKPKNIMITKDGAAKLADMGLARAIDDEEAAEAEAGRAYGTPYYISPEQIRGIRDVDFRADIYSLGATLYHMVTGRVPFEGPNPTVVMRKHLKEQLRSPDQINTELSNGISEVIEVMMVKDRVKRYASTEDLLEDLRAIAEGNPPLQARKAFDLTALAEVEDSAPEELRKVEEDDESLLTQPLFWIAIASGVLNLILLFIILFGG